MSPPPSPQPPPVCRQCGHPEAHAIGEELLCAACLHARGSCGAGRDSAELDDLPAVNDGQ